MFLDLLKIYQPFKRLIKPFSVLWVIFGIGTVGYWLLGEGEWSWMDCAYMTAITMSTVGFKEAVPAADDSLTRVFTMGLILVGTGTMVYLLSKITAFFVEGELNELLRRRKMERDAERMRDHYVVCGVGRNGEFAAKQLAEGGHALVVIDRSEEAIQGILSLIGHKVPYVVGDATDEDILTRAGVARARGLIAALAEDQDNIFLVLGAREINPNIRVVAKSNEQRSVRKFRQVGVQHVVNPAVMGGHRMYQEMVRPQVTNFVDALLLATGQDLVIEEVAILGGSEVAGRRLVDSGIRSHTDTLILGVRDERMETFVYNPGSEVRLEVGAVLIAIGTRASIVSLEAMCRPPL